MSLNPFNIIKSSNDTMVGKTILGLFGILVIGMMIIPAFADIASSPYKQLQSGVPFNMIQCSDDKILLKSPSGKPVCLMVNSSIKLMDRGYTLVESLNKDTQVENTPDVVPTDKLPQTNIDGTTVPTPDSAIKDDTLEKTVHLNHPTQDITNNTSGNNPKILKEPILSSVEKISTPCDQLGSHPIKYDMVDLKYIMKTGKVQTFCVQPDYKWFEIHLQTQGPGTLTVEIPKDVVDLRQFDYPTCQAEYDIYTDLRTIDKTTMKQIAQTDSSRTIQFIWEKPLSKVGSFGAYGVFDGVDYSEPNYCINKVESGEKSAEFEEEIPDLKPAKIMTCPEPFLNYTITNGNLDGICSGVKDIYGYHDYKTANGSYNIVHDTIGSSLGLYLATSNVTSDDAVLIIDIPWIEMRPNYWSDAFNLGGSYRDVTDPECSQHIQLLNVTADYRTFKIPLDEGETGFHMGSGEYNSGFYSSLAAFMELAPPYFAEHKDKFLEPCHETGNVEIPKNQTAKDNITLKTPDN